MAEFLDREHYIPIRVADLVEYLCSESGPRGQTLTDSTNRPRFAGSPAPSPATSTPSTCASSARLKEAYTPFDPDADPKPAQDRRRPNSEHRGLWTSLFGILRPPDGAGELRAADARRAGNVMQGASSWGIDMDVAWDAFDTVEVFYRGKGLGKRTRRNWRKLWRREEVTRAHIRAASRSSSSSDRTSGSLTTRITTASSSNSSRTSRSRTPRCSCPAAASACRNWTG